MRESFRYEARRFRVSSEAHMTSRMNRERFTQSGMSSVDVGKEQLTWLIYLRNEEKEKRGLAEQILICVWTEASECARRCAKLSQRGSCPRSHLSAKRRGGQFRLARCGTFASTRPSTPAHGIFHSLFLPSSLFLHTQSTLAYTITPSLTKNAIEGLV